MTIKIGVLSDTHLNSITSELEDIYRKHLSGMDVIIHAGDYVSPEIVDFFSGDNFHGVHGNMDTYNVREMLPDKKIIKFGAHRIGLIHGWGPREGLEDRILGSFEDVDVIVYGHSHSPANHIREGILLFNPGSAIGYNLYGPHSIGVLEIEDEVKGRIIDI